MEMIYLTMASAFSTFGLYLIIHVLQKHEIQITLKSHDGQLYFLFFSFLLLFWAAIMSRLWNTICLWKIG